MVFALCSGSAYAISVDGYSVVTYFNVYNNGLGTQFENTITTTSAPRELYIVVDSIVSFEKGEIFDIQMGVSHLEADSVELIQTDLYNTKWNHVETIEGYYEDGVVSVYDIEAPRNLKCVRFTFKITNPVYYYGPVEGDICEFYVSGNTYKFEYGVTWKEYLTANPKLGECVGSSVYFVNANGGTTTLYHSNKKYTNVYATDLIMPDHTYYLSTDVKSVTGTEAYYDFSITSFSATVKTEEQTSKGIFSWVKKIYTSITELPKKIVDGIGEKLTQLKDALLEGIKNLFIPTEDQILELRTKFEELLASRFGAVYESSAIIDDFYGAFTSVASAEASAISNTVSFPVITVNLAGTPFSFGGWEVDVVPDGFEGIIDVLKVITSLVCTFLFVNALRKRLEGILGR